MWQIPSIQRRRLLIGCDATAANKPIPDERAAAAAIEVDFDVSAARSILQTVKPH
jgi:hypothetical protein